MSPDAPGYPVAIHRRIHLPPDRKYQIGRRDRCPFFGEGDRFRDAFAEFQFLKRIPIISIFACLDVVIVPRRGTRSAGRPARPQGVSLCAAVVDGWPKPLGIHVAAQS
jgi:hypothetical protein